MTYALYVGVDIAAASASVAFSRYPDQVETHFQIKQTTAGYTRLRNEIERQVSDPSQVLVVMEATGTYWMRLALHLHQFGYRVSVINPSQAHHYAKAMLKRGKTDEIDATVLAHLAATFQPKEWHPWPAIYEELQQRLVQRDQLVEMLTQVRNQRHALTKRGQVVESVLARQERLIAEIEAELKQLESEINQTLQTDAAWGAAAKRLQTIPGIGLITAGWLLVATHNFSVSGTPEAVSAYAGLVPVLHRSGTSVRGREGIGHRGHKRLRTALYLATLSAVRHNPIIRTFYQRLIERGKLKQVALCAAARKLLHLAWAVVKKECDFDPNYTQRQQSKDLVA